MARFTLSISDELNTWLDEQAELHHRSKNQQIESMLRGIRSIGELGLKHRWANLAFLQLIDALKEEKI